MNVSKSGYLVIKMQEPDSPLPQPHPHLITHHAKTTQETHTDRLQELKLGYGGVLCVLLDKIKVLLSSLSSSPPLTSEVLPAAELYLHIIGG